MGAACADPKNKIKQAKKKETKKCPEGSDLASVADQAHKEACLAAGFPDLADALSVLSPSNGQDLGQLLSVLSPPLSAAFFPR